jgi:hypothetical protein
MQGTQREGDMKPPAAFLHLVKMINRGNAAQVLGDIAALLAAEARPDAQARRIARHLDTIAYRFEGSAQREDASRVYDLLARIDGDHRERWRSAAVTARLRAFCEEHRFDEADAFVSDLRCGQETAQTLGAGVSELMRLAWLFECRYEAEPCVQCYRLAYELSGGGQDVMTVDGHTLERKIRDIRNLQMRVLAEQNKPEEAERLHAQTRALLGLGPIRLYNIVPVRQAVSAGGGSYQEVLAERRIREPEIKFLGGPVALDSQPGLLDAPPQYLALLRDCLTVPRSNVVLQDDRLVYDLAAHPLSGIADIRDGVNPDQIMFAAFGGPRALVAAPPEMQDIDAGLMMFGFQSKNYGHWLLEFVPRMLWFNHPSCPRDYPICIDDHMPATHSAIIELIDDHGRTLMPLPPVPARFRNLGVAPVPAFFPFDMRPGLPVYDTIWPGDVLGALRRKVLDRLNDRGIDLRGRGRRLFLSRQGFQQRQLLNEAEIGAMLQQHGFEIVHPERMSFSEQVQLYHAADIIVGSASSALTNCIFCRPQTKVVALIHENRSFNFRGYTSMIESSGAELMFIRGETQRHDGTHHFHANYTVPPAAIRAALGLT